MASVGYKGAQPYEERDPGALDEHEGAPSSLPPPPNVERPSNAYVESKRGSNEPVVSDAADVEHMMEEFAEKEYTDVAKLNISAFPSVKWAESWSCGFGGVRVICVGAWVVFLLFPVLFYFLALPTLQRHVSVDLTTFFLLLFGLTALCFLATGCQNPGVPPQPAKPPDASYLPHPGDAYSLSRDTNRYVLGFDHFCEFVGNDIGRGNLGCFVTFLVLLSMLCTYVMALSGWEVFLMLAPGDGATGDGQAPPPQWHFLLAPWRLAIAAAVIGMLAYAFAKCVSSDVCAGVMPLIMMMPGASVGAVLIVLVFATTVLLPLITDMWTDVTVERNPTAFFLILPILCFAVLFWGMSAHWVFLLCDGLTQKMWLRAQGYRRPKKPTAAAGGSATDIV